ncbi:MAG: phosphomethylpyrimidine synthase [Candidatus Schekmanbacteria bacterium RBG_13_48_7]|uniref:Phosphomethylpyrimidine synthase n=1 Tax=Candidatus Schekmanbacteria bacterium RBG_13_48_7 TaxID=1817878 RepID=A0A1F7S0C9_9BACT|nr:MAG: phosphomethylpyrimidine synthase [Candidatus Schekmanbacteria bacterium RBG_13_48_7]
MTQLEQAKAGKCTPEMKKVALYENVAVEQIREFVAAGKIVIPCNKNHKFEKITGIGSGLKTKVNANLGTSPDSCNSKEELKKMEIAIRMGADTVMDLSIGGDIDNIRRNLISESSVPVGTVPVYQAAVELFEQNKPFYSATIDFLYDIIEKQAKDGVDFMTIHCGLTLKGFDYLKRMGRVMDVVSRGGALLVEWMVHNHAENPFYTHFDRLLEISRRHDITISLGDGLRPGCLADATDNAQIEELNTLGELVKRCRDYGVQVMVEGPGHVPLDQIETNVKLQKSLCKDAPFYVLGPIVTDIAPGYDHITSAIGGALAAWAGADFLCYVTPSEHLRLPDLEDVRVGVVTAKIAAHAADIAKHIPGAAAKDLQMAIARKNLDWETQKNCSLDPEKMKVIRESRPPQDEEVCSMCGRFCSIKSIENISRETHS